jgi:hypothetical protein
MSIVDKINRNIQTTILHHAQDIEFMQFFMDMIAPKLEPILCSCNLETDISAAPRWNWPVNITLDYTGSATNEEEVQYFLREIEDLFDKQPSDWDFGLDSAYGKDKYNANFHFCGNYILNLGNMGYYNTETGKDWKGFQLELHVQWLPPCAKLIEETRTYTKEEHSYVCV